MEAIWAVSVFSALSQETRLESLRALVRKGPAGLAAGELAAMLGAPAPTMSFHLKALHAAGLVLQRREGRRIVYAPNYGGLRNLVDFLLTDCCQGDPRLCGPYVIRER